MYQLFYMKQTQSLEVYFIDAINITDIFFKNSSLYKWMLIIDRIF